MGALFSAAPHDDEGATPFLEVNAEAWSIIDPQFADALSCPEELYSRHGAYVFLPEVVS
jgi:hypothetical protein